MRHLRLALGLAAVLLSASSARAQHAAPGPDGSDTARQPAPALPIDVEHELEQARTAIEQASFDEAELALDRAAGGAMDRALLLRWLELRALLAYADGRLGALEEALVGYATVAEGLFEAPVSFPTPLRRRLEELEDARIEIAVEPALAPDADGRLLTLPAQAIQDPGHIVRRIVVAVSVDGAPELELPAGRGLPVAGDVHSAVEVSYRATAHGPGGAVVATHGDERTPRIEILPGLPRSYDDAVIGVVVTAAAVVVAGAVILGWGASEDWWRGGITRIDAPTAALRF